MTVAILYQMTKMQALNADLAVKRDFHRFSNTSRLLDEQRSIEILSEASAASFQDDEALIEKVTRREDSPRRGCLSQMKTG